MPDNEERGTRHEERKVFSLLLAAGAGSRFGGDKLTATLRGRPVIAHAAAAMGEAVRTGLLGGGVAVTPVGSTASAGILTDAGFTVVENPEASKGLSTSLITGLAALSAVTPPVQGALIVLADQPALRVEVIEAVVNGWRRSGKTTRPRYAAAPAEPGHPVLLDRGDWSLAGRLTGDQGLRQLLTGIEVTLVDVAGANPDVDTPDDLRRLEENR